MTKLLKTSLLLAAAPFVLAYGEGEDANDGNGFSLSVELKGGVNSSRIDVVQAAGNITDPAANANNGALAFLSAIPFQSMTNPVREAYDKIPYSFGGRVVGSYGLSDDFRMSIYAGADSALQGGKTAGTYGATDATFDPAGAGGNVNAGAFPTRGTSKFDPKIHVNVGARISYHNLSLCGEYDMSKIDVTGNAGTNTATVLNKEFKNNNFLFGARAETAIDAGDFDLNLFVEGFTNFSRKAEDEVTTYSKNLSAAYFTDTLAAAKVGNQPTEAHMNIMKLSLGLGFNFANL